MAAPTSSRSYSPAATTSRGPRLPTRQHAAPGRQCERPARDILDKLGLPCSQLSNCGRCQLRQFFKKMVNGYDFTNTDKQVGFGQECHFGVANFVGLAVRHQEPERFERSLSQEDTKGLYVHRI